jgi:hypothetical protein
MLVVGFFGFATFGWFLFGSPSGYGFLKLGLEAWGFAWVFHEYYANA